MAKYKEYKVEMLTNGVWGDAHEPNGLKCPVTKYEESIARIMQTVIKRWDDFRGCSRYGKYGKKIPTDFRVVSRDVIAYDFNI